MMSDSALTNLSSCCSIIPSEILQRLYLKNNKQKHISTYPPSIRSFALTLQFYSNRAYEYVRQTFDLCLPSTRTLRQWYSSIEGKPGFTQEAFRALSSYVKSTKSTILVCNLVIDEMAIKKHVEWDGTSYSGFIDMGTGLDDDSLPLAKEAYVFMVVAINANFKLPCAYFLIDGLNGQERANIVKECIIKLDEIGIKIISITFDGTACNFAMANYLGAKLQFKEMCPYFPHPSDNNMKIYVLLDPSHMLKLMRNALADKKVLQNSEGQTIQWRYIEDLHYLQEKEGLHLANKLSNKHINWKKQKMKVVLAAQTLSQSVADAIEFAAHELQLEEFQNCEATVEFIRLCDKLFDISNSLHPLGKQYKAALRKENENSWRPILDQAENYFKHLIDPMTGKEVGLGNRKTPVIGFLNIIATLKGLFTSLVDSTQPVMKYILTGKFSQDHLEHFFNSIRARGGWNNNPTAKQFMAAYKRMLIHHEILASTSGNCLTQNSIPILFASSSSVHHDQYDISLLKRYSLDIGKNDDDSTELPTIEFETLSKYCDSVVEYIAGFVVKSLMKIVVCPECKDALMDESLKCQSLLIRQKDKGGLLCASNDVIQLCKISML